MESFRKKETVLKMHISNRQKKLELDLLIATPPCQGVSKQAHQRNESLNDLIIPTLRIFNALLPQIF